MTVEITLPTVEDEAVLLSLTGQLGYSLNRAQLLANLHFHLNDDAHFLYVARQGETVVGYFAMAIFHWFHKPQKIARLSAMVVDESHRSQGIGKALMLFAENLAREQGCETLELTSSINREAHGTHAFYRALGYVDIRQSSVCFRKQLH